MIIQPHVHDNADLSFVIYCDIPEVLKKEHDDFVANKDNEHKVCILSILSMVKICFLII